MSNIRPFFIEGMAENYKDTLKLPKTAFPMRANLGKREPERVEHWQAIGLYQKIQEKNQEGEAFILHDGPPFTNGDLHLGHALNKTLKEIVLRYKSAKGYRALRPWLGLPRLAYRATNGKGAAAIRESLTTAELRDKCDAFSEKWIGIQQSQFKRLGVLGIGNEYKTKILPTRLRFSDTASFIDTGSCTGRRSPSTGPFPTRPPSPKRKSNIGNIRSFHLGSIRLPNGFDPELKTHIGSHLDNHSLDNTSKPGYRSKS